MAMIKSALELALEKTKDMKADKGALEAREAEQRGKRLAGEFMDAQDPIDLKKALAELPAGQREGARDGAIDIFMSHLQLPIHENAAKSLDKIEAGLAALASQAGAGQKLKDVFQQLNGFLKQYLDDLRNFEQTMRKQFAPKLKQKEQELSRRMGRTMQIDPMQDPEFANFFKQNLAKLRGQYQDALDRAKEDIKSMI